MSDKGIGYTLGTGRLFCDFSQFQEYAEELLGRPVLTHEFADAATWAYLREAFESAVLESSVAVPSGEGEDT